MQPTATSSGKAYSGLEDKISAIQGFYSESLSHPDVRALAEALSLNDAKKLDIVHFFNALRGMVRYLPDPVGTEMIKAPWVMVDEIHDRGFSAGDCDDLASLAYSLLHSVGVPAGLYVGWYGKDVNPTHIFVGVPQKSGSYQAFDLCAPKYGVTKPGLTKAAVYA